MNQTRNMSWYEANQQYLMRAIAEVRQEIERSLEGNNIKAGATKENVSAFTQPVTSDLPAMQPPSALETLCSVMELSSFERKVLLMCAGLEMDSSLASLYAKANHDERRTHPTFGLALGAFADAHWSALSPGRPLRYWNLVELSGGESLTASTLVIQERILHYLAGVQYLDDRLRALVKPVTPPDRLAFSHQATAREIAAIWSSAGSQSRLPVIELCGVARLDKRTIAAAASAMLGLQLHAAGAWSLPHAGASELSALLRLWEREAILNDSALLLECDEAEGPEVMPEGLLAYLLESLRSPLFISTRSSRKTANRAVVLFDITNPTRHEQVEIWRDALKPVLPNVNGAVETLVSQFSLNSPAIYSAAGQVVSSFQPSAVEESNHEHTEEIAGRLWDACRAQARPRLEGLAQRIVPVAGWDDLVLPAKEKEVLHHIAVHVRQRPKVYETWGFASKGSRGLGISALFAGPSGTGKTMAAEVLANELRLDLYRIDLSQVINKYIGETEKNLRRVFDAAEEGAAVLLFDEADALFGKRSEVKDSHDRYANIEVSYLLQRMEAYRGLAILTTNRKSALDQAFLRRIRFVVEFPFPEIEQRAEIWRRVFPDSTPREDLRIDRLARLSAAGGHIRNIAMSAAFLAADAGQPVRMSHLLSAARSEFAKMEKPLTDVEIAGWV
jgi:ATPase family protein associated with various cellular activities (AAA)/winged helix domain-containing protein